MQKSKAGGRFEVASTLCGIWVSGLGLDVKFRGRGQSLVVATIFEKHGKIVARNELINLIRLDYPTNRLLSVITKKLAAASDLDAPVIKFGERLPYSLCVNRPVDFLQVTKGGPPVWRRNGLHLERVPLEEVLLNASKIPPAFRRIYMISQGFTRVNGRG